jgi:hypothetical protein
MLRSGSLKRTRKVTNISNVLPLFTACIRNSQAHTDVLIGKSKHLSNKERTVFPWRYKYKGCADKALSVSIWSVDVLVALQTCIRKILCSIFGHVNVYRDKIFRAFPRSPGRVLSNEFKLLSAKEHTNQAGFIILSLIFHLLWALIIIIPFSYLFRIYVLSSTASNRLKS